MGSKPSTLKGTVVVNVSDASANQNREKQKAPIDHESNELVERLAHRLHPDDRDPLLAIAIDFGTTYSGFAFSFKGMKERILTVSHCYKLGDDRVRTIVLLNPDKTFNSFGLEAEQTYSKLDKEKDNYYYFEHFKMALYKTMKSSNKAVINDSKGRTMNAKEVFMMLIENVLHLAMDIGTGLRTGDISWIISIPAIWSDFAMNIIRQSVLSVGIEETNLRFVLEPHAASLHCMKMDLNKDLDLTFTQEASSIEEVGADEISQEEMNGEGDKYILADIGGGTSDVWVFETHGDGELQELHRATKEIGGHSVNTEFAEVLEALVGENVWTEFRNAHTPSYNDFMIDFERKKKCFSSEMDTVTMSIPNELLSELENKTGDSLVDVIKKFDADDKFIFKPQFNKLILHKATMEDLFEESINGILGLLEETVELCEKWNIHNMFLVGGYSESPYLRENIMSRFRHVRVVFHEDARLAVLKGAVMMAYRPRMTYHAG